MTDLNTRKNVVPTFSRGRVITSTLSYIRYPHLQEQSRISTFFVDNTDYRSITGKGFCNSPYDSLYQARTQLRPQNSDFIRKNLNFLDGVFRLGKIFSNLFFSKSLLNFIDIFSFKFASFVPKKVRFRKKGIFEGLNIFLNFQERYDLYFFWRTYMYFQMSTRANKKVTLSARNVHTLVNTFKMQDLTGLYFLGAGVLNLDDYQLSFEFMNNVQNIKNLTFPSLSTPKSLRLQFKNKISSVSSHFRLLS